MNIYFINHKVNRTCLSSIILGGSIIILTLPLLLGSFYALPSADDFSNANDVYNFLQNHNSFIAACKMTWSTYLTWQGTFTGCFFIYFFRPFEMMGLIGLRLFLCLNVVLLLGSILWFGHHLTKNLFGLKNRNCLLLFELVLVFVSFMVCRGGQEIFYWYTGACVYTMPISLTFCCFAFYLRFLWEKKSRINMIVLCILAFMTSGGVLQTTAILCYGMLTAWGCYFYTHKNRDGILAGVPFMAALAGALINALAPGNFVRHSNIEEGIHIFRAIKNVFLLTVSWVKGILMWDLWLYLMILCVMLGLYMVKKHVTRDRKHYPIAFFVIFFVGMMISLFPVCLGYGGDSLAPRNVYICDLYLGVGGAVCALEFGGWLGQEKGYLISKEGFFLTFICVMLIFFKTGEYGKLFEEAAGKTFYQLRSGEIKSCSEEWLIILDEIENSEEQNVVVQVPEIPGTILKTPGLSEDENWWVNQAVAQYYGKDTVAIRPMEK